MGRRVFVIDDEPEFRIVLTELLSSEGFVVTSFASPKLAMKTIETSPPDMIILDIPSVDLDGLEVCKNLRTDPRTWAIPIIVMSTKNQETDVVVGLGMGADDYVGKPLRYKELLARIKTVLRRLDIDPTDQRVQAGPISVDYGAYTATLNNKRLELTPKELELLGFFVRRNGRILTRASISETVWGTEFNRSTRTIDVHVDALRRKLGRYGSAIVSLKGVGYRLEIE